MGLVKGTIHGVASMVMVVLGAVIAGAIKNNVEVFKRLSDWTVELLVGTAGLPVDEEVAAIVIPVGVLMSIWVVLFELKHATS